MVVDFDGFKAVDGVDLTIEQGELRFLIGPNGAGKTSLVDVITGLTKPTEGEITFDGQPLAGVSAAKRVRLGIGRSFQTPTVFESLTVVENLDLAETYRFALRRMLRRRKGVSDGVTAHAGADRAARPGDRPAAVLSHGQKQWLEIGMLLVQQPKLVLLDEPVAGMSGSERQATGELLEELAEDHTVVVIEHDMAFLRRFARSVTVLHEGTILSEGSVDYVQGDPRVREVYLGRSRDERSGASRRADMIASHRSSTASVSELGAERSEVGDDEARDQGPRRRLRADAGRVRRVAGRAVGLADVPDGPQRRRQDDAAEHGDGPAAGAVGIDPARRRGHHQGDHVQAGPAWASATSPRATRCSRG